MLLKGVGLDGEGGFSVFFHHIDCGNDSDTIRQFCCDFVHGGQGEEGDNKVEATSEFDILSTHLKRLTITCFHHCSFQQY